MIDLFDGFFAGMYLLIFMMTVSRLVLLEIITALKDSDKPQGWRRKSRTVIGYLLAGATFLLFLMSMGYVA